MQLRIKTFTKITHVCLLVLESSKISKYLKYHKLSRHEEHFPKKLTGATDRVKIIKSY